MERQLIGQLYNDIEFINHRNLTINFLASTLIIECPWRIEVKEQMYAGSGDFAHAGMDKMIQKLDQVLAYQKVMSVKFDRMKGDLIVYFSGNMKLIVYPDNYLFENWQWKMRNQLLVSQAGGEVTEF